MIKKFLKIIKFNIIIFICLLSFISLLFYLLNLTISGQPRYWEIVHKKSQENLLTEKEKIIQIKKKRNQRSKYLSIFDTKYKELNYSGFFVKEECGTTENGYDDLIYQVDKNGFRENKDYRYIFSDYVLIGDSFIQSICENKPNDLKTNLLKQTNFSFLNLGMTGTTYSHQFLTLDYFTKDTNFDGLIWFFYEGNDYENILNSDRKIIEDYISQIDLGNENFEFKLSVYQKINSDHENLKYESSTNHKISSKFRFQVWLAEFIRGPSVLFKFFRDYKNLLNKNDYNYFLNNAKNYLDKKNVSKRYIVYIPSWQKLSLYKLKKYNLYEKHPQIKQLNKLKSDVKIIAEKNSFNFIDTEKYFFNLENPLKVFHYELNTHFNKFGYKLLSTAVVENLN